MNIDASSISLKNILILSSREMSGKLTPILKTKFPKLNFVSAVFADDLKVFEPVFLKQTRLLSFLSNQIVPIDILNQLGFGAINLHPGTPRYPGWQAWQFALYDGVDDFGITAHWMEEKVDTGKIIALHNYSVRHVRSEQEMAKLTINMALNFLYSWSSQFFSPAPLEPLDIQWSAHKTTKSTYRQKCAITTDITNEELTKIVRAFGNGDGLTKPNITMDGICYELLNGQNVSLDRPFIKLHHYLFAQKQAGVS